MTDPDRILVTAGTTHTLNVLCHVLGRRGARAVAFENPSHRLLHAIAEHAGLRAVGVNVDDSGLDVDELAAADVGAVVVSPAHQFPTGCVLAASRRARLVEWAAGTGALIVENDYDAEFRYDRTPIGAMQGLAAERVAYVGSVSKTLAPGLRLGWAVLPGDLVEAAAEEVQLSMFQIPGLGQLALADFLARGEFDRHLQRMRTIYKRRRDALVDELGRRLPGRRVSGIAAGLHVVVELESESLESAALEHARERGVALETLSEHTLPGYTGPPGLLVGFGAILEPAIGSAVERLASALEAGRSVRTAA